MRKLKRLIESGSDMELVNYIRGDFSARIDGYLDISAKISEMKKRYVELAESGTRREAELSRLIQKFNTALDELKRQTN